VRLAVFGALMMGHVVDSVFVHEADSIGNPLNRTALLKAVWKAGTIPIELQIVFAGSALALGHFALVSGGIL
jgi:hypothetical protein